MHLIFASTTGTVIASCILFFYNRKIFSVSVAILQLYYMTNAYLYTITNAPVIRYAPNQRRLYRHCRIWTLLPFQCIPLRRYSSGHVCRRCH